jgi:group I intron endonuclease
MSIIYKITNNVNSKVYIGVTENFTKRKREHISAAKTSHKVLYRAMRKYGIDAFSFEIIEETSDRKRECFFISEYKSTDMNFGYNLTNGGEGTPGFIPTDEARESMRQAKLGKKLSSDHKRKIGESGKGRVFTSETKTKISQKLKGNKNFEGKSFSPEVIRHLSNLKAKTWNVITPDGDIITITNLRKYCIENDLSPSAMSRVMNGQQAHHKNYRAVLDTQPL